MGTVVDSRWRIDALLGSGSTSAVYEATHRNGHRAALKVLHRSLCADAAATARFLSEAGIANAIKHRAIVPIRDDGMTEDGCAYLVVDLHEGETLETRRQRNKGRIAAEELAPIVEELMSAIAAVHAAGVVHRDLKPQNVFITTGGALKLLDFGTARIFDGSAKSSISVQGLVLGTPAFMAPEQARGARTEVDAQSDVWSLGAMMFTLLSGEHVHTCKDAHAQLLAAASQPARKLTDVAPSIDDRVAAVVDRALAYDKKDRWADAQAMRVAFRNAIIAAMPTMRDLKALPATLGEDEDDAVGSLSLSDPSLVTAAAHDRVVERGTHGISPAPVPDRTSTPDRASSPDRATGPGSEPPAVSVTGRLRSVSRGIPAPALATGIAAMAAMLVVVAFFLTGADHPAVARGGAGESPVVSESTPPTSTAAPAASFLLITAPDEPKVSPRSPRVAVVRAPARPAAPAVAPALASTSAPSTALASTSAEKALELASPAVAADADAGPAPGTSEEPGAAGGGAGGGATSEAPDPKGGSAPSASMIEPSSP